MLLIGKCGCVYESEKLRSRYGKPSPTRSSTEIMRIPEKRSMFVTAVDWMEVSIAVKDEKRGFDVKKKADPTTPENTGFGHGRGIYLMRALMDEVRFEEGGVVIPYAREQRRICSPQCTQKLAGVEQVPIRIRK